MAMFRYGYATVVEPSVDPSAWTKSVCCGNKSCNCGSGAGCRTKVARTVLAKYSPEKYLLSHCTIIAAVDADTSPTSKSKYKDYLINPAYSKFVNNNGDAWTKKIITATYKSFVGANNYLEHVQIPELSKGKVVDAVLREIPVGKDKNGKELTTYYVDILVATERKHEQLVRQIEAGEMNSMSMGCKIAFSICTKCGNAAVDETQACDHVRFEKGSTFTDDMGVTRKVAELCGHSDEPDSVQFIDASWVANPAFTGAVRRSTVAPSPEIMAKFEEAHNKESYTTKAGDFLKVAQEPGDKAPKAPDDPPPKEDETEDQPPAEAPGDAPTAPEDTAPAEEPANAEPDELDSIKTKIKKQILQELGDQLTNEMSDEDSTAPRELDTLDETMIHPAASKMIKKTVKMRNSWDRYLAKNASNLDKKSFDKLRYGSYILLTAGDVTALRDYGYNRRDFLAVMSFLDGCFKNPLGVEIKKAMARINGTHDKKPEQVAAALTQLTGQKIAAGQLKKAYEWLRVMDKYPE